MRKSTKKLNEKAAAALDQAIAAEVAAVNSTLDLCKRLDLEPENLGLQRNEDGTYRMTYLTHKIMEKMAKTLRLDLSKPAQPA